jgi:membrane-bound ClpP family serine protease
MKSVLALLFCSLALPAHALEMTSRRIDVSGSIDTKAGAKLATDMMKLNEAGSEPIYLLITATSGSAQGVMLVADAIRALESPVVAVVLTPVHGAGAALPLFADRIVMMPSAQLVFTEVDYEGVAKPPEPADAKDSTDSKDSKDPKDPKEAKETKPPSAAEQFLQKVRNDYLDRFWGAVAKRLGERSAATLRAEIESRGGRVLSAQEALDKKIAYEIAKTLVSERTASEKTELKITTTRSETKTVTPDSPPSVQ